MQIEAGPARAEIDAERGGRLSSLVVDGHPLLFSASSAPLQWGSYPMVPWAGRVADGRFSQAGVIHELPRNLPPHSAHGLGFVSPWTWLDDRAMAIDLGPPWPFGGRVEQAFDLEPTSLTMTLTVSATEEMPVMVGWHPWFNRFLGDPAAPAAGPIEAELDLRATSMYELDRRAIPTGRLVEPPPGPWDNCFTGLAQDPTITWPGLIRLRLSSSCDHWVVYTEPGHALCVEPQSGPPDQFNRSPRLLAAGQRYQAWFRLGWELLA